MPSLSEGFTPGCEAPRVCHRVNSAARAQEAKARARVVGGRDCIPQACGPAQAKRNRKAIEEDISVDLGPRCLGCEGKTGREV